MQSISQVFLAHSSADNPIVGRIAHDLAVRGVPVWLDEWEIKVGDSLHEKIAHGIEGSGWFVVALSRTSVQSPWVTKELNAGLVIELERREVFVLPALLEQCEIPLFLKDKKYADFRTNYEAGLDDLVARLIPDGATSLMLKNIDALQLHLLPAFSHGEVVRDYDLNRVQQAINLLQKRLGLPTTAFQLMRKGQIVSARHINSFVEPIDEIRRALGLRGAWQHHPVSPGELYTVAHMNELYGRLNEAIRMVLSS